MILVPSQDITKSFPFAVFGVLGGAIIIYIFKFKGAKVALLALAITLCVIPFSFGVLIHCPTIQVAGITTPYPNR